MHKFVIKNLCKYLGFILKSPPAFTRGLKGKTYYETASEDAGGLFII